jgi:hypothetical protein
MNKVDIKTMISKIDSLVTMISLVVKDIGEIEEVVDQIGKS